jgi:hypothetical protein
VKRKRIKKAKRVLDERRDFYVYKITRPDKKDPYYPEQDAPVYFGRGTGGRMYCHRLEAKRYQIDPTIKVVNVIKTRTLVKLWEYGLDFTEEIVVSGLTNDEANDIEMSAIAFYGRINNGTGILTNMDDGGNGATGREPWNKGKKGLFFHTDEAKKRIGESKTGDKNPAFGVPKTEEWLRIMKEANSGDNHWTKRMEYPEEGRRKISLSLIGTARAKGKRSPEACKNISDGHMGQVAWNKGKVGVYSEETLLKMSESHIGIVHTEEWKKNQSESMKGDKNPNYEKHPSEETRLKMSESSKGQIAWNIGIPVPEEQKSRTSKALKLFHRFKKWENEYIKDLIECMRRNGDDYGEE